MTKECSGLNDLASGNYARRTTDWLTTYGINFIPKAKDFKIF